MSLFNELRRRNVLRVGAAYIVSAWLIVQVVETLFPLYGLSDATIRLVVTLLAIGLLPVVVLAWAFELTPEGLKKDKDVDNSQFILPHKGKKLDRAIMVVLVIGLGYFAVDKFVLAPAREAALVEEATEQGRAEALVESYGDNSIAVLPFVNMSDDSGNEYFSDGISEELLNQLSRIPSLRVISRSSSFSFKSQDIDVPTVARQLNVAHVLEGSVRKAGNRVRITAQLIEARSDTHLWSASYDRELDDIFAVQDEISAAIVGALKESMGLRLGEVPPVNAPANAEAHEAYLRGRFLIAQRTPASVEAAIREFEEAVSLDPNYALAHAELSLATRRLSFSDTGSKLTRAEAIARAAPHAERAMELDPTLAQAHAATGYVWVTPDTMETAIEHFRRAIDLNPNYSDAYLWLGNFLGGLGHYKEAFSMLENAARLDPLSRPAILNYAMELMARNRLDEADRQLEKLASIDPAYYATLGAAALRSSVSGQIADSLLSDLEILRHSPDSDAATNLLFWFAILGLEEEALALSETAPGFVFAFIEEPAKGIEAAEALFAERPNEFYRFNLGLVLAAAGRYERAGPLLEESWQKSRKLITPEYFSADAAMALIAIRQKAGDKAGVAELHAAIKDNVRRYREAGISLGGPFSSVDYEAGLAAFLDGDREKGLALIGKAVENGYFIRPNAAYLREIYDEPGFITILASQQARQARERQRFLAVVCNDNPDEQFWKPAEGTCERFEAGDDSGPPQ